MRFADIKHLLQRHFPTRTLSDQEVSRIVELSFPRSHRERSTCVYGVRQRPISIPASATQPVLPPSQALLYNQQQLLLHSSLQVLQTQNAELAAQLAQLRSENEHLKRSLKTSTNPVSLLEAEIIKLSASPILVHGPDTIERVNEYSLDAVMAEVQRHAPNLLQLLNNLGNRERGSSEGFNMKQMKTLSALCTLLNARSRKMSGFQLFVSTMLIGRGTSKQV